MNAAHLAPNGPTLRANAWGHSFRLTEPPPPHDGSAAATLALLRWLDVETHARWRPKGGTTYCNVYAHDVCNALGAYLPRVWWNELACASDECVAVFDDTVHELSANALYRWLEEWGGAFGWSRVATLDGAQDAANEGRAAVICARRIVDAQPGHISIVAPESSQLCAIRDDRGVRLPVQSQAGGRNEVLALARPWWIGREFAAFGFWVHDGGRGTREVQPTHPDTAATPIRIEREP